MSIFNSYQEYMQSELWRRKRTRILARDNYRCQKCGSAINLRVHHIRYPECFGDESDDDLITLCDSCHQEVHRKDIIIKERRQEERTRRNIEYNKRAAEKKAWADETKYEDFVYGGFENMCALPLLKKSAEAYAKENNCDPPGVLCLQISLAYAHRVAVRLLLHHGYTENDIYLRTPLQRQTIAKYATQKIEWRDDMVLSRRDLDKAASDYVCEIINTDASDRRNNK